MEKFQMIALAMASVLLLVLGFIIVFYIVQGRRNTKVAMYQPWKSHNSEMAIANSMLMKTGKCDCNGNVSVTKQGSVAVPYMTLPYNENPFSLSIEEADSMQISPPYMTSKLKAKDSLENTGAYFKNFNQMYYGIAGQMGSPNKTFHTGAKFIPLGRFTPVKK